jgi:two-component system response regulator YcbB
MLTFYIVDDDISVRRMLANIIETKALGKVIGYSDNGDQAYYGILDARPDIVLMDLLIHGTDGIETIRRLKEAGNDSHFIMISQVNAEDMVTLAYQNGIEFFIHKPINVIEVLSVINKTKEFANLKKSLSIIHRTVEGIKSGQNIIDPIERQTADRTIDSILFDLGINGEAGSIDIKKMLELIRQQKDKTGELYSYKLSNLYGLLSRYYKNTDHPFRSSAGTKAIEQRIRRAVSKALQNLATMGIENPSDSRFSRYSTCMFDYKEIKQEMDFLRNKTCYHGKINVRKFMEGVIAQLNR